jgi:hypothetical protein
MTRMLITPLLAAGLLLGCDAPSVAFRLVFRSGDPLVGSAEPMDPRTRENVIHVLRLYPVGEKKQTRQRRSFSPEFKAGAVKRVLEQLKSVACRRRSSVPPRAQPGIGPT